jgi:serine/tyrosine/threonine adenylyltransferase
MNAFSVKNTRRVPLQELKFEHTALAFLPVDENQPREVKRELPGVCFSLVDAQPLEGPELVCLSKSAFDLLGVEVDENDPSIPKLLSLSATFSNCKPYAHCYCGHQFGAFAGTQSLCCLWGVRLCPIRISARTLLLLKHSTATCENNRHYCSGQLGDGAATSIGEVNTPNGRLEMQFKGAGQTPYSRSVTASTEFLLCLLYLLQVCTCAVVFGAIAHKAKASGSPL